MHDERQTLQEMKREQEIGREIRDFFRAWTQSRSNGAGSGGLGPTTYQYLDFTYRQDEGSPEVRLAFYANQHEGHPVIHVVLPSDRDASAAPKDFQQTNGETSSSSSDASVSVTPIYETIPDTREPDAVCEGCGVVGTIGRATRTHESGTPSETHRFCSKCWVEQSARYRARWDEERRVSRDAHRRSRTSGPSGPSYWSSFESMTWHGVLELLSAFRKHMQERGPIPATHLTELATLYRNNAHKFEGEMPYEVELFINQYAPPSS